MLLSIYWQCFTWDYSCRPPCWVNVCLQEEMAAAATTTKSIGDQQAEEEEIELDNYKEEEDENFFPTWALILLSLLGLFLVGGGVWLLYYVRFF